MLGCEINEGWPAHYPTITATSTRRKQQQTRSRSGKRKNYYDKKVKLRKVIILGLSVTYHWHVNHVRINLREETGPTLDTIHLLDITQST